MEKMIMALFARTPVHVGAGNSVGAVDSPVQRERHTQIPIIPGSSLKGVLSDLWNDGDHKRSAEGKELFGEDDNSAEAKAKAGALLIGEARVLAFPVRSAKGMFAWVTSPLALRRFKRESGADFDVPPVEGERALAFDALKLKDQVVLEEYSFQVTEPPDAAIVDALAGLIEDDPVWNGITEQLVIVSDEVFQHFCEHACEVVSRIRIDDETGVVAKGALFNQEQVPSETLFYASLLSAQNGMLDKLKEKLRETAFIQVGGDATTGLGFCSAECSEVKS